MYSLNQEVQKPDAKQWFLGHDSTRFCVDVIESFGLSRTEDIADSSDQTEYMFDLHIAFDRS